jgi:hypothetical protein
MVDAGWLMHAKKTAEADDRHKATLRQPPLTINHLPATIHHFPFPMVALYG